MKRIGSQDADYILKSIIIGDSCVGKTSILRHLVDETFENNRIPTIGIDFGSLYLEAPDKKVIKNQIWDCAGQERFRSIIDSYYRKSNIVFLVYDITSRESFANLDLWLEKINNNFTDLNQIVMIVVGNKNDLSEKSREVSKEEGEKFAKSINATFFETSAKNGENIFEIFSVANLQLYEKHLYGEITLNRAIQTIYKKHGFDEDEAEAGCGACTIA